MEGFGTGFAAGNGELLGDAGRWIYGMLETVATFAEQGTEEWAPAGCAVGFVAISQFVEGLRDVAWHCPGGILLRRRNRMATETPTLKKSTPDAS